MVMEGFSHDLKIKRKYHEKKRGRLMAIGGGGSTQGCKNIKCRRTKEILAGEEIKEEARGQIC